MLKGLTQKPTNAVHVDRGKMQEGSREMADPSPISLPDLPHLGANRELRHYLKNEGK